MKLNKKTFASIIDIRNQKVCDFNVLNKYVYKSIQKLSTANIEYKLLLITKSGSKYCILSNSKVIKSTNMTDSSN